MRFREGDFIESKEKLIFDVKGLVHPPEKAIAFVRYIPNTEGDRKRDGLRYKKVYELSERYDFLRKNYPQYIAYDNVFGEFFCEVPVNNIAFQYSPQKKIFKLQNKSNLEKVERETLEFVNFISDEARVAINNFGISGSVLVGLFSDTSDIDIIVYGIDNCTRICENLKKLLSEGIFIKPYNYDNLLNLYKARQRDTGVSIKDYIFSERRKSFQGFFKGRDFFIRYIKDWNEIDEKYEDAVYRTVGYSKIEAKVVDDSESIFTPCLYGLSEVEVLGGIEYTPISQVASFRGRFCEQAKTGEKIIAQGKLERVEKGGQLYYRLLLGNNSSDFMITIDK